MLSSVKCASRSNRMQRGCGFIALTILLALSSARVARAHGEQIEVGKGAKGPVEIGAAQQKAIGLKLAAAEPRPLAAVLNLNGEIQLLPNRQADVSLRISGQVRELYANLGDTVRAGQRLVLVQSRLVGDPPPSVVITAPMSGTIDVRGATLGQAVEPNTTLFHISDRSQVIVVAKVYEADLGKIRLGQEARVRALSYPDQTFAGKVTLIDPNLDAQTRTVKIWIQLANPQALLKPNMFARANVVLKRDEAALTIPNAAIIEANGEKFVFVREGDKFSRVEITIGNKDDDFSEVTDGLVPGDEVATQGSRQIYTLWLTGGKLKAGE